MTDTTQQSEVERVARAIATAEVFTPDEAPVIVGMKTIPTWQSRLPHARAALAILQPKVSEADVREVLERAHETMHQCTAVLTASDCVKVAATMAEARALLDRLNHGEKA